jgi:hypothetical protein
MCLILLAHPTRFERVTFEIIGRIAPPRITVDDVTYMQPKAETASWSCNIILKLGHYFSARLMWPLPHGEERGYAARLEPRGHACVIIMP